MEEFPEWTYSNKLKMQKEVFIQVVHTLSYMD